MWAIRISRKIGLQSDDIFLLLKQIKSNVKEKRFPISSKIGTCSNL